MNVNGLKALECLTIADIIEFAPIMKLPHKDAVTDINLFIIRHDLGQEHVKDICNIVIALGLYP